MLTAASGIEAEGASRRPPSQFHITQFENWIFLKGLLTERQILQIAGLSAANS